MPHFSGFLGNEWAESSKAGRHPSEDLAAGELDGLMKTIHLIPLDLSFPICTEEYLVL